MKELFESLSIWLAVIVFPSCVIILLSILIAALNKKKKAEATVISKRQQIAIRSPGNRQRNIAIPIHVYYISFRLENGKEIERECSKTLYNKLQQNDIGILTYNHDFVIAFD